MMKKKLIIVLAVLMLMGGLAFGQELRSTISSGGTVAPTFQDIKGEAVIGEGGGLQMGGIYTMVGTAPVTPVTELVEGPVILEIARKTDNKSDDVLITWSINTARFGTLDPNALVDIYWLKGNNSLPAGQYDPTPGVWVKIVNRNAFVGDPQDFSLELSLKRLNFLGQVGTGVNEAYFKGVLAGSNITDLTYGLPGAVAVGKFNIDCVRGFNLISSPFVQKESALYEVAKIVGAQLPSAGPSESSNNIYNFDDPSKFPAKASYIDNNWSFTSAFQMLPSKGYWVELNKPQASDSATFTLVGKVAPENKKSVFAGFNLIGNPSGISKEIAQSGFLIGQPGAYSGTATSPGDQIYNFKPSATAVLNEGAWVFSAPFKFNAGNGFWYEAKKESPYTPYDWTFK